MRFTVIMIFVADETRHVTALSPPLITKDVDNSILGLIRPRTRAVMRTADDISNDQGTIQYSCQGNSVLEIYTLIVEATVLAGRTISQETPAWEWVLYFF